MKLKHCLAALLAAALLCGALAEPVDTEYLVDMTGAEVLQLQQQLNALGYLTVEYNGEFNADTRSALESFQQANGLEVTGAADAATLDRLNSGEALSRQDYLTRFASAYAQMTPLETGAVSNDVLLMQRRLKEYGYYSGNPDGVFDETTRRAVESFQMVNGLEITGVADGSTLMRLTAESPITWPAYLTEMSCVPGDSGLNVYALQQRLTQAGYFQGDCTGSYGDLTRQAVAQFQTSVGLDATGSADAATWAALYSGSMISSTATEGDDTLRVGDAGDAVSQAQQRLNILGFFDQQIDGEYGLTTETAVRLFQMANNLSVNGELSPQAYARLMDPAAVSAQEQSVQDSFQLQLDTAGEEAHAALGKLAAQLQGASFGAPEDGLYPGFSFVQYVCVRCGLPVLIPEDIIRLADQPVDSIGLIEAGDIVVFQNASTEDVNLLLAIGAGDGKIFCTTESGGWVVLSYMDQMQTQNMYRWNALTVFGE